MIAAPVHGVVGSLCATFRRDSADVVAEVPLELRGPFRSDGAVQAYQLRNVTSGVFASDSYDISLRVETGANVVVRSPSATKVYAMPGGAAQSRLHIEALSGSHLHYLPEPVILQASSDYEQTTELVAHESATVIYSDIVVLGRLAAGERLAFRRFSSHVLVRNAGQLAPLYEEHFELVPGALRPELEAALGDYGVMVTLISLRTSTSVEALASELSCPGEAWAGVDTLPGGEGILVRGLTRGIMEARALLELCLPALNANCAS